MTDTGLGPVVGHNGPHDATVRLTKGTTEEESQLDIRNEGL